jgi:hypothetical protein
LVSNLAAATSVTHAHIVGRIKKGGVGTLAAHQPVEVAQFAGIAAQQAMFAELPQISRLADRWAVKLCRIERIGWIRSFFGKVGEQCVDFRWFETSQRDVEIMR